MEPDVFNEYSLGPTPESTRLGIRDRLVKRRKELGWSQLELSRRSGVSYGSLKRFERLGEISLSSLIDLAAVLDDLEDFSALFAAKKYQSLQEALDAQKHQR
jgi:transcriptional regulator with XRE-family HTH domain